MTKQNILVGKSHRKNLDWVMSEVVKCLSREMSEDRYCLVGKHLVRKCPVIIQLVTVGPLFKRLGGAI